jgi:hypothetical protein
MPSSNKVLHISMSVCFAGRVLVKGGERPTPRAIRILLGKTSQEDWRPGQPHKYSSGRPPIYTGYQKNEVAI